jgi:predicted small integral membrane protein
MEQHGFLPFNTNAFDRVFISVVLLVAIHLLWMRFLEAYFPLEIATILSILIGILIVRKG